jgi:superfamily II DNA/RNA helicase
MSDLSNFIDESKMELINNYLVSEKIDCYDSFDNIGIHEDILRGIYSYGFTQPSPIQKLAIKPFIDERDLIIQSHSGTGKTATFMISILNRINPELKKTQAVVVAPTRELAKQIYSVYQSLSNYTDITGYFCIGGSLRNKYNYNEDINQHIIIGTPGRVSDLIGKNIIKTNNVKMLVIDEADDVLSISFQKQLVKIFDSLSESTQLCLFSATIPSELFILTDKMLKNPLKILVKDDELSLKGIQQYKVYLGNTDEYKYATLCDLYNRISIGQAMIYCNKRYIVDELTNKLREDNFSVSQIHGEMQQKEREQVMQQFRDGITRILISTDVLARGIDVQQVSLVINYDIPKDPDTYIHRIGRSGRYGRKGIAINFETNRDRNSLKSIEMAYNIKVETLPNDIEKLVKHI